MPGAAAPAAPSVRRCGAPACTLKGQRCRQPMPCPHHAGTDPTRRCAAMTRQLGKGEKPARCLAWPLIGTPCCPTHDPARREQQREYARQRQAARQREQKLGALRPARDLAALLVFLLDAEFERPGGGGPALARLLGAAAPSTSHHAPRSAPGAMGSFDTSGR